MIDTSARAPGRAGRRRRSGGRLLVLVYLRKGETFAETAAGFGVGTTTAWRYAGETVCLLAAPVREAKKAGYAYVVVDGTLIPIDRLAADRPFYSANTRSTG